MNGPVKNRHVACKLTYFSECRLGKQCFLVTTLYCFPHLIHVASISHVWFELGNYLLKSLTPLCEERHTL